VRRNPQRSCIGCRTVREKQSLVRLVHTPDDRFVLDPAGKLPGRGAYLCASLPCLEVAIKRKAFDRAFRQSLPREAVAELQAGMQAHLERCGTEQQ